MSSYRSTGKLVRTRKTLIAITTILAFSLAFQSAYPLLAFMLGQTETDNTLLRIIQDQGLLWDPLQLTLLGLTAIFTITFAIIWHIDYRRHGDLDDLPAVERMKWHC